MNELQSRGWAGRVLCYGFLTALAAGPVCAESGEKPAAGPAAGKNRWTRIERIGQYSLKGSVVADKDLSGIACISDKYGLIGADESREVQVVELSREARTLRVIETVSLLPSGSEIDTEAIAAEDSCYYIVGSHGISKKRGERQNNRYSICRLRVDPTTGLPVRRGASSSPGGARASVGLERATLAEVLRADPVVGPYFGQPLQQKGLNIEGLAVRDGHLFVGLRNPNLGGYAFVMEIAADEVFGAKARPHGVLHRLRVGEGLGIREMVAAQSGFLLIVGNAGSEPSEKYTVAEDYAEDRDFFLYTWDGQGSEAHRIGALPDPAGKAEAMMILEETAEQMTVLILFDGAQRGRPTIYRIQ